LLAAQPAGKQNPHNALGKHLHLAETYKQHAQKRFQDANVSPEQIAWPFNHLAYEAFLYAPFSVFRYQRALADLSRRKPRVIGLAASWPEPQL